MSDCSISQTDNDYKAAGNLTFENALQVLKQHPELPSSDSNISLNVDGLTEVDSAGLSVFLHWVRAAQKKNQTIRMDGMPAQLESLITISGLTVLL